MGIERIVVSVGEGPACINTAKYAIYLAKQLNAKLIGVYVIDEKILNELLKARVFVKVEAEEFERDAEEQGKRFLERIGRMAESKGIEFESFLLRGEVHEEVVKKCSEVKGDLLVMGELKELSSRRELFYDEGERILRESHCPVLVVRNPEIVKKLYREMEETPSSQ